MKTFQLGGTLREGVGKKATNAVRNNGNIPCVLYGGSTNITFQVTSGDVRKLVYTPEIFLVELTIDGKQYSAIMKDLQFHPVSDKLLHIDFYEVSNEKPVEIAVPVRLEGLAEGVKAGGKLQQNLRLIKVKGLVNHIPEQLKINVEDLGLGKTIQIIDLSFPNLILTTPKTAIVATVNATRATKK
ncbi:50S ribosomal protein L25/general stress protein Ctc [Microbacter margulisiae]|uniref:Large ribosomal subunit protein bL25 n=1 Tax=Microbacter margulisiae TaxID=1350067 RepID=A0A7W5H1L4_9PORP|nr:50S ribosomal protein L25/general stress protein Ctc [Microbacter margulisiae]MBB3187713.1 large subunit ribosomal protein L25 [Microbacter margulisiae]